MKPKILFLISNLESGGVSKSMVSLLNVVDTSRYDVSLWIASPHGVFLDQVPKDVRLITDKRISWLVSGFSGVKNLAKSGYILLALGSLLRMVLSQIDKSLAGLLLARMMPCSTKEEYDLIVDYNGQQQLYYMVNKLHSRKKVTFFHSDYDKWPFYRRADRKYFPKTDRIFTISDKCADSLRKNFQEVADKIAVMENIISPRLIESLAKEEIPSEYWGDGKLKLLTIGHVSDLKGSHWALEAASIFMDRGVDFHWTFVGAVSDMARYTRMAKDLGVEERITFLGVTSNPYPYLAQADIVVHPSQFEGKSIALDEAKLMCKPIVVTNFSTVHDQFEHRHNATICEMTPESIADSVMELIADTNLRNKYIATLEKEKHDNSSEVEKLYTLID